MAFWDGKDAMSIGTAFRVEFGRDGEIGVGLFCMIAFTCYIPRLIPNVSFILVSRDRGPQKIIAPSIDKLQDGSGPIWKSLVSLHDFRYIPSDATS